MTGCAAASRGDQARSRGPQSPSREERGLVAAKAGDRGGCHHPRQREVAKMRRESGQHEHGFALGKATHEHGEVAVVLDEALQRHRLPRG